LVDIIEPSQPATRRRHSKALKARVLAECAAPGASVAAIALSHGLNANLVHRWRRLAERGASTVPVKIVSPTSKEARFVAVPLPTAPVTPTDIRIEVRRGATAIAVTWPVAAATECGAWLRELLR
jgi:transposase